MQKTSQDVEKILEEHKKDFSEPFGLRMHRAISWLKRAEDCRPHQDDLQATDADFSFISSWIAFNALYTRDIDINKTERGEFRQFINQICALDKDKQIYDLIWITYDQIIRNLLENQYVFQEFWDYHNQKISKSVWERTFKDTKRKVHHALKQKDTDKILETLFIRLYTLRNQIMHGGSTYSSTANRHQVQNACQIMLSVLPSMMILMIQNHARMEWGKPFYPFIDE